MPIGTGIIYNVGDLILGTVSGSGTAFLETKIAAATSSIVYFDSNARINSASLNSITVGTASYVSGSTSIITNLTASNISASGTGSFGMVGIGTTSPNTLLQVHGIDPFVRINNTSNGDHGIKISYGNSDAAGLHLIYNPNDAISYIDNTYPVTAAQVYGDIRFRQNVASTMTTRITIKADGGNVGIGTTSPSVKLHVDGFFISKTLWSDTAAHSYWGNYSTAYGRLTWDTGLAWINATAGNVLYLGADGANKHVTIATSGNVGIGTTSPDTNLEIYKSVSVAGESYQDILTVTAVDNDGGYFYTGLGAGIAFRSGKTSANVYGPSIMGSIYGANSGDESVANGYLSFHTRNSNTVAERMRIINDGNVGIGTTSPAAKLQVAGNISGSSFTSSISNAVGFLGTSSWAQNVVSASFATTAQTANALNASNNYQVNSIGVGIAGSGTAGRIGTNENGVRSWTITPTGGRLLFESGDANGSAYFVFPVTASTFVGAGTGLTGTAASLTAGTANALNAANTYTIAGLTSAYVDVNGSGTIPTTGIYRPSTKTLGLSADGTLIFKISNVSAPATSSIETGNFVVQSGNFGLGTNSPNNKLDIFGGTGTTLNMSNVDDGNRGGKLTFISSSATGRQFYVGTNSSIYNLVFGIDSIEKARIDTNGNLGIGTTSPGALLEISSSTAASLLNVKGAGGNGILFVSGSGNVGIGTTVPSTKFHVVGNAEVGDSTADTGLIIRHGSGAAQYGRIRFYSTSTNINTIHSFPTAWNSGTFLNSSAGALNLGGTNGVTFGSWNNVDVAFAQGGNNYFKNSVGIGTTVPASLLHVYSTSAEPAIRLTSTSGSAKTYGLVCNTPWAPGSLHIYDYTADASRIHISSNGNVGIGVGATSPGYKLEVIGSIRSSFAHYNTSTDLNSLRGNLTTMGYSLTNTPSGAGWITVYTSQNNGGDIISQLGYDNYNQQKLFTRYSADFGATWSAWKTIINSDALSGTTNYVPKFSGTNSIGNSLIYDNGTNVGIGTTSPSKKLHVIGSLYWDFNGTAAEEHAVGIQRTVAAANGAYTEIGSLAASPSSNRATFEIFHHDCNTIEYSLFELISNHYAGTTTDWVQLPSRTQAHYAGDRNGVVVDARLASNGANVQLRLRSIGGACGAMIVNVRIKSNTNLTETSATGTGATVAGLLGFNRYEFPVTNDRFKATTEGLFILNNGNIGIGTTGPIAKLEAYGGSMDPTLTPGDPSIFSVNSLGVQLAVGRMVTSPFSVWLQGKHATVGGGLTYPIVLNPLGGFVGIGTTSPTQKLHVAGDALIASSATAGNLYFGDTSLYVRRDNSYDLSLVQAADSNSALYLVSAGSVYLNIDSNNNDTDKAFIVQNNALKAGTELFRVQENGNVGIGTTSPGTLLNVHGATPFVRINTTATADHGIKISYGNSDTHGLHLLYNANSAVSYIDNTYPVSAGYVFGDIYFRQNVAGTMTTRMTIKADGGGNVGIGTTNPATKLAVNGVSSFGLSSKLSMIGLDINSGETPTYVKIITTIPVASGAADFTVNIKGFIYGASRNADISISWHYYNSTFYNPIAKSSGGWAPTIRLSAEGGFVAIVLSTPGYWPKFYVESMYSSAYNNQYVSGWSWVDADATGSPIVTVPYASDFGNSFVMLTNGNVGIGTTSPNAKLDVNGSIYLNGNIRNVWGDNLFNVTQYPSNFSTSPSYYMGFQTDATNRIFYISNKDEDGSATDPNGGIIFRTGGTPTNRMLISYTGNVGIGTTSPTTKLYVSGSVTALDGRFISNVTSGTDKYFLDCYGTSTNQIFALYENSNTAYLNSYSSMAFRANQNGGSGGYFVFSGANVGIGTTVPTGQLHLYSSTSTIMKFDRLDTSTFGFEIGGTTFGLYDYTNSEFRWRAFSRNLIINESYGDVGIGTAAPAAKLEISGSSNSALLNIKSPISGAILFVSGSGAVGINTSTVGAYTLQVNGSFAATTKSFIIDHPTKAGKKLIYGSLESPYHGIRLTGRDTLKEGKCKVELPDYIYKLILHDSVNIQLTGIKCNKTLYVDEINIPENYFTIAYDNAIFESYKDYDFFWDFTGIRTDVPELITEL